MSATLFYIAPCGNVNCDGKSPTLSGRARGPWPTIQFARDRLRELRKSKSLTGPVQVLISEGIYPLRERIDFGPEDSHTTYRSATHSRPVLDGGVLIEDGKEVMRNGRRTWIFSLPRVAAGHWYFKSLFVDGVRRPRARLPKFSPDSEGVKNVFRIAEMRNPEKRGLFEGDNVFRPKDGDLQNWKSLPDSEIVLLHYWIETRMGTPVIDAQTGWIRCSRKSVFNLYESFNPKLARYYVDNLFEALTDPGEWYLDRAAGVLFYLPFEGQKLDETQIIAPVLSEFLSVRGTSFNQGNLPFEVDGGTKVEGLHFHGLSFQHGDWFALPGDYLPHNQLRPSEIPLGSSPQAAMNIPAAIDFRWAKNCSISFCEFNHVGLTGVEFGLGCTNCEVDRNSLDDMGAGAIRVHGAEIDGSTRNRTGGIRVADNRITNIGRVFHQGTGILIGTAFGCEVLHNLVARTCYTAISVGWSWGYRDTLSKNHRVEGNDLSDIGQGVLSDLGAIYLLGVQPGTVVRNNHIRRVTSADYGGWGIYPDEGSSHILIENNWVHDTQGSALRIHFSRELVVRNNIFARTRDEGLIGIGKVESHIAATFLHNLFLGPAPSLIDGGYAGDVNKAFCSNCNLIWFHNNQVPPVTHPRFRRDVPRRISWHQWRSLGHERNSILSDPRIRETATALKFPKDSPVFLIGFRPFDWSQCGPRTEMKKRKIPADIK